MTKIEWTDETWNPIAGCSIKSAGCDNCYAMRTAHRLQAMGLEKYQGTTRKDGQGRILWTGKVNLDYEALIKPLSWGKARRIFVNSMSDLFHDNVPDHWINKIFAVMALCPHHTFQILTKRPERMKEYLSYWHVRDRIIDQAARMVRNGDTEYSWLKQQPWPLSNVWLGVSVEDQKTANTRIPELLKTPSAVRWISAEPLLAGIDLESIETPRRYGSFLHNSLSGRSFLPLCGRFECDLVEKLDWVVVGGESGPNARPMHPDWVRSLRDQCGRAGVPFFFKQWGDWVPWEASDAPFWESQNGQYEDGHTLFPEDMDDNPHWNDGLSDVAHGSQHAVFQKVGKKSAGNTLDGEKIQQYPEVKT